MSSKFIDIFMVLH